MSGTAEEITREERSEEEFDAFYARTYPWLAARAVMLSGNRQNAEDAVQEAYIEAMRRWPEVRACASPEAWVTTTMRRKLSRDGRRWWFRWKPVELTVPAATTATVEETAEALAALRALGTLPPRQRQVVVMHSLEGMSYQAISAELGISVGSVGSNLHKARARLSLLLDVSPELDRSGERLLTRTARDPLAVALYGAVEWLSDGFRSEPRRAEPGNDAGGLARDGDLDDARDGAWGDGRDAAWGDARDAAWGDVCADGRDAARDGVRDTTRAGVRDAVRDGVRDATRAGARDAARQGVPDATRAGARDAAQDGARDPARQGMQDGARDAARQGARNETRDTARNGVPDTTRERR
ncbi:sigma-70 family RNA polymerase sigma factor [Streptomyces luomodiensis]|uniref:Sigma-70 family RNA polymerase sigma factor n=1 Tax=Streptomyces luomodiensis TaxID=3026192 RepID=A0ABY9UYI9_9ACTN|nr:sigma-70 family RNA polymerase sigma factor [Streptomyces sp. SCA4-21]WNE97361.1 sigma-70 family RNA polymerase sigma factor [Streptomyces sp. SCA4-21]